MNPAAAVVLGIYAFSAVVFVGLMVADGLGRRFRIRARRPVQVDAYPFISEKEQTDLYARFEAIVAPLRVRQTPTVPGGESR
ncbi:hypothetical protein O7626_39675 [Micromonospora sp. WMMD1102]|uniref:hypothetical protein n=1 Tax=Micromonospora sp. WMMD1102 TaxID=3016105 RepID=UPI002415119C|nr:hypothetical protein [Micromonospora sp. WMMD1102]MDG4791935.1 hypothetical protein [Micromonospora sp. WMMD1102]